MMNCGEVLFTLAPRNARQKTHEQDCRTDLEMRAIVVDHALEDLGMQKCAIEESRKSLLVNHPDQAKW